MTLDQSLESARVLAESNEAQLGECIYSMSCGEPKSKVWHFYFDMVDGPPGWYWIVFVGETGLTSRIWAVNDRPRSRTPRAIFENLISD